MLPTMSVGLAANKLNPNNDFEVQPAVDDGISQVTFSPTPNNFLLVSSWDSKVRLWQVDRAAAIPKHVVSHNFPVLCNTWSPDGMRFFSGSCDKTVKMTDMNTLQSTDVARHDAPVSAVRAFTSPTMGQIVITASWDKTIKYWDCRSANPVLSVNVDKKIYCMDMSHPCLVVGTEDRIVNVYHLDQPNAPWKQFNSLLKYPPRCIAVFPSKSGFAAGSIEGRVAIQNFEEQREEKKKRFFIQMSS